MKRSLTALAGLIVLAAGSAYLWWHSYSADAAFFVPLSVRPGSSPQAAPPPTPRAVSGYYEGPVNCHQHPTLPDTGGARKPYADFIIHTIAPRYRLEAAVLLWQVNQESGFNPDAVSPAGAIGIAQFLPDTARRYHIDPHQPYASLDAMARYDLDSLRSFWDWSGTIAQRFHGNRNSYVWGLSLAAYNAGGGSVGKALAWAVAHHWYKGAWTWLWWYGRETFQYVPDILGCLATH